MRNSAAAPWWLFVSAFVLLLVLGILSPPGARALSLEQVGNFTEPTYVTPDPGDPDRLFVVERSGQIQLVDNGQTSLFLDIESIVLAPPDEGSAGDTGLFSMEFSPEFETDSLFYVAYSSADDPETEEEDESGEWHLAEFTADGDSASPASRREVLAIEFPPDQTFRLHDGGQLHFGPDGHLYASTGDGGPQGDPYGNAQNLNSLLGKMLRIDPQTESGGTYGIPADNPFAGSTPGEDEIWSYGLRNPWRFSFDRLNGDLVIGDVGYRTREEVNFAVAPDPGKGANFGWNCREGTNPFLTTTPCDVPQAFTDPVFEYEHVGGNCAVTGGYVVRDPALGELFGRYLYADFCLGELRSLALEPQVLDRSEGLCVQFPTSFGEDSLGRIYVTSRDGPVYRLAAGGSSGGCATDTTPPDTQIDTGPTGTIAVNEATFTFSGDPASDTAKIQCRIDSEPFADCTSPKTFTGLTEGPHTATFRAEDAAGNQDATPATRTFTVDTTATDPPPPGTDPSDTTVYKAKIGKVKVSGPKKVKRRKKATYKVKIKNSGNVKATGVRLKVRGRGVKSKKSVGKIGAKKTRTVKIKLKPKKTGKVKLKFKVTSKNAGGKTVKKKIRVKKIRVKK